MEVSSVENTRANAAEASKKDATALPLLRTYRESLEKEAGALGAATRRNHMLLIVLSAAAGIVGFYALWETLTASPPIVAWVIAGGLAIGAAAVAQRWKGKQRERTQHLEGLHEKMLSAGRKIDGAERRLRG